MPKKKCPKCNSRRTSENKDYFACNKCGFIHYKTEREEEYDAGNVGNS